MIECPPFFNADASHGQIDPFNECPLTLPAQIFDLLCRLLPNS